MRPTSYQSEDLDRLLRKHKIATLDDLKAVLGTDVDSTVFRKLNELAYRTSYSHRGSYYTLDEIAQFDRKGLWSLRSVWFSKYGTLLATVKALVAACEAGYYVDELSVHWYLVQHPGLRRECHREVVANGRTATLSCSP